MGCQLIVIADVCAQAEFQSRFRIPGDELFLIVVEIEVEGIARVHIDHDEIGVVHGEFAEAHIAVTKGYVIAGLLGGEVRGLGCAENLHDVATLNVHRRDFAEDVRGRKNLFRIEDQVVFFYGDAVELRWY